MPAITAHAIERFRELTGAKYSDERVATRLTKILEKCERVRNADPRLRVRQVLLHGDLAEYWRAPSGWVLVVRSGALLTIHDGQWASWEPYVEDPAELS